MPSIYGSTFPSTAFHQSWAKILQGDKEGKIFIYWLTLNAEIQPNN